MSGMLRTLTERLEVQVHLDGMRRAPVTVRDRATGAVVAQDVADLAAARDRERVAEQVTDPALRAELEAVLRGAGAELATRELERAAHDDGDNADDRPGRALTVIDPEPWPEPVQGTDLIRAGADLLGRHAWFRDPGYGLTVATWALATWCVEHLRLAPVLVLVSATKICGKSTVLELLELVARRPRLTLLITPAALFRLTEQHHETLLIDEAEGVGSATPTGQDLLSILNAGYRRGYKVIRVEGDQRELREYDCFGFRALAAIRHLPDTLISRSIRIQMERAPHFVVLARWNYDRLVEEARPLVRMAARWARDHGPEVARAVAAAPRPDWLARRAADNWAVLFGVGAVAGGDELVGRLVKAARVIEATATGDADDVRETLLGDLRQVWADRGDPEYLDTGAILPALNAMEDRPWPEWRGRPLTGPGLAALLKPFGVRPVKRWDGGQGPSRGYLREQVARVWVRYLPEGRQGRQSQGATTTYTVQNSPGGRPILASLETPKSLSGNAPGDPGDLCKGGGDTQPSGTSPSAAAPESAPESTPEPPGLEPDPDAEARRAMAEGA